MTTPAPLRLDGGSLLSKWGFSDGDLMADWAWDNLPAEEAERISEQHHDLLIKLVRERLLPKLSSWNIEITEVQTLHNPIRARRIDGVEVGWRDPEFSHAIENVEVLVPAEDVMREARRGEAA